LLGEGIEHESGEPRREDGISPVHAVDGCVQLSGGDRLCDVAPRAGPDHPDHVLRGIRDREGEELDLGLLAASCLDAEDAS
jgi:hypothetical protein